MLGTATLLKVIILMFTFILYLCICGKNYLTFVGTIIKYQTYRYIPCFYSHIFTIRIFGESIKKFQSQNICFTKRINKYFLIKIFIFNCIKQNLIYIISSETVFTLIMCKNTNIF